MRDKTPQFVSSLRQSRHREVVRARWVAEQHFEYEVSNDADTILLSMRSHGPLSTAVMLPDASGQMSIQLCRDRDEQHAFYSRNRSTRRMAAADISTTVASDWYCFVSGSLTHSEVETGTGSVSRFAGILPISDDEDTISGELGFGLPESAVLAMAEKSAARRHALLCVQQAWLEAIRMGDVAALANLYAPNAQLADRGYPDTKQTVCRGRDAIAAFYASRLEGDDPPKVDLLQRCMEDWYAFSELVWEQSSGGVGSRVRTAMLSTLDDDGYIAFQLGCGADIEHLERSPAK